MDEYCVNKQQQANGDHEGAQGWMHLLALVPERSTPWAVLLLPNGRRGGPPVLPPGKRLRLL